MRITSPEKQNKILRLYRKGTNIVAISKETGVTRQTIRAILMRNGYVETEEGAKYSPYRKPTVRIGDIIKIGNEDIVGHVIGIYKHIILLRVGSYNTCVSFPQLYCGEAKIIKKGGF